MINKSISHIWIIMAIKYFEMKLKNESQIRSVSFTLDLCCIWFICLYQKRSNIRLLSNIFVECNIVYSLRQLNTFPKQMTVVPIVQCSGLIFNSLLLLILIMPSKTIHNSDCDIVEIVDIQITYNTVIAINCTQWRYNIKYSYINWHLLIQYKIIDKLNKKKISQNSLFNQFVFFNLFYFNWWTSRHLYSLYSRHLKCVICLST